jgi:hypothetical protein
MAVRKPRLPKVRESPQSHIVKTGGNPASFDSQTISWHFHRLDRVHAEWGWDKLRARQWREILTHLVSFEGLTWAEIQNQSGGRKRGSNSHSLEITELCKAAQDRLVELRLDDFESVFSLRINNTLRLYGVRDGRVLQLVWHDPHHGSKLGACPTTK